MKKLPGRLAIYAVVAILLMMTSGSVLAQTHLNFVHMPEILAANGQSVAYPVYLSNGVDIDQVVAPIDFVPGTYVRIDSVSTVGSRFEGLGIITKSFDLGGRKFWVTFDANEGTPLPAGDGLIATVHFLIFSSAPAHNICVDSATIDGMQYAMLNTSGVPVQDLFDRGTITVFTQRPIIHLDPSTFTFNTPIGVNPPAQTMEITNLGIDPLNWDITYKPTWLSLSAMNGTAPSSIDLMVDVTGLGIGTYNDSIAVHDEFATPKVLYAQVSLVVREPGPPIIGLDPDEFFFVTTVDVNPLSQMMDITNLGDGALNWDISYKPDWLTLNPASGTAPSSTELSVDVTGLAAGEYNDSVAVHDANADPQTAWAMVHLTITEVPTEETRCIALHEGWNLISWNVDTQNDDIEAIIANVKGCIDGVFGFEIGAATYDPDLPQFSTLTALDHLHGYWFRMDCDTVLCVTGMKAAVGTPIGLESNWNLVSYLPDDDNAPEIALQSMIDDLVVTLGYDNGGLSYDPDNPQLASLDFMRRDFGYWLKTTDASILSYPGEAPAPGYNPFAYESMKSAPISMNLIPTREWIDLYGEGIKLDGQLVAAGSVVEVYDEAGNLCGQALVESDGRLNFTPVYFDDKSTTLDEGIEAGSRMSLSINGEPVRESYEYGSFGDRVQIGDLSSVLKLTDAIPHNFSLDQNFPNPFNPSTLIEFSLPAAGHARIEVFNLLGEKVNVLVDRNLPAGHYSVNWNGDDLAGQPASSGIYFYRLSAGEFSHTRKMMLVK
ncbi:MAG: T9SS type A sorting domain-containing protein [Candidatus Zixiibacteriota bacterium]